MIDILINNNFKNEFIVLIHTLNIKQTKKLIKLIEKKLRTNKKKTILFSESLKIDNSLTKLSKEVDAIIINNFELIHEKEKNIRILKTITLENDIPIIVLYHLDDKICLDLLKKELFEYVSLEKGELVQASDLFAIIYRNKDKFRIKVLKNRYGNLNNTI